MIDPSKRGATRRDHAGDRPTSRRRRGSARRLREQLVEARRLGARQVPVPDRARPPGDSREFAVLESMDGGKPIKESRDVDVPLAAAHFFYYAGWADKLEYAFPAASPAAGRGGADHPVELPAADARLEARAGARRREHRRAQARRDDAAHCAALLRRRPPGRAAARRGEHRHWRRPHRRGDRQAPASQVAFTGSTDVGKAIQRELAGTGKKLTLELGGKAANMIFDDAALDQAVEGIVNGIYFNQGHVCCAGSRLLVQESVYEDVIDKLKHRMATLRVGDPLDKNTDVGAINSKRSWRRSRSSSRAGRRRAPRSTSRRAACREGLLVRADGVHERRAELPDRAGGDLRAGALRADLPHARRGGREGEQHAVRPVGGRLDGEGLADPLDGAAPAGRRDLGEHVQPLRPRVAVRRLQGVAASAARAACTGSSPTWSSRTARRERG